MLRVVWYDYVCFNFQICVQVSMYVCVCVAPYLYTILAHKRVKRARGYTFCRTKTRTQLHLRIVYAHILPNTHTHTHERTKKEAKKTCVCIYACVYVFTHIREGIFSRCIHIGPAFSTHKILCAHGAARKKEKASACFFSGCA